MSAEPEDAVERASTPLGAREVVEELAVARDPEATHNRPRAWVSVRPVRPDTVAHGNQGVAIPRSE